MSTEVLDRHDLEELLSPIMDELGKLRRQIEQQTPEIMDKPTLAKYLKWSPATINRRMKEGMPYVGVPGEDPRFYRSDVDNWMKSRK